MLSELMEKLAASLACVTYRGDQHTHILIEETDALAKLKKVTLAAPTGDWFAFAPDKGRGKTAVMSPLLAVGKEHDHHRACDCVIFVVKDAQVTILYLDLKSGNPRDFAGQFKSTRQFVRYVLGLLEEFQGQKMAIHSERFIVLYAGKPVLLPKTPSVPKKGVIGRSGPNAAYQLEVPNEAKLYLKAFLA